MAGISNASRELDVAKVAEGMEILFLSETEFAHDASFNLRGFTTFYTDTPKGGKVRILALVVNGLVSLANVTPSFLLTSTFGWLWTSSLRAL